MHAIREVLALGAKLGFFLDHIVVFTCSSILASFFYNSLLKSQFI